LISGTIHDVLIPEDILLNKRKTLSDLWAEIIDDYANFSLCFGSTS
jgi:hypothetical protein